MNTRPRLSGKPMQFVLWGLLLAFACHCYEVDCPATEIRVDASRKIGAIRAIHGVNGGPISFGSLVDVSQYHRKLGIPLTRTHDANWPNGNAVDIHAIFPNFHADADLPASYRFGPTDDYVKSIVAVGSGVMYRLGESIEHSPHKYYVHKPVDFDQWAKICLGIIRHYNEGWADGFKFNIRYFEIWNEPDARPFMWDGTDEDYYRLYGTVAKAIKSRYPALMVGGPAATSAEVPFLRGFLDYCKKESLPLDFLSWHCYTADPSSAVLSTQRLRRQLDEHGFKRTETHLNEWNYLPGNSFAPLGSRNGPAMQKWCEDIGGVRSAAFASCVLLGLQDAPIDMTNFYMADNSCMSMFNFYGVPRKPYYAFLAFKALADHPVRVALEGSKPGQLSGVAGMAVDGHELAIVVSNYKSADKRIELTLENLPWAGRSECELLILDEPRNLEPLSKEFREGPKIRISQDLPAPAVLLIYVRKAP